MQDAQSDIKKLQKQHKDNKEDLNKAVNLHRQGNIHDAVCLYKEILLTHPKDPDVNHNMGLSLFKGTFWEAVLKAFNKKLVPKRTP